MTVSPGVNPIEWNPDSAVKRNPFEMILATNYTWIHNVNALRWFVDNVLPIVRKSIPNAQLSLIGKNVPDWLKEYSNKGVNIIGYVDKVQPYLNRANIYISPLFVGSGIRFKILEAMSMALPVVASPIAAEGINASSNDALFICDSYNEFAEVIIELFNNINKTRMFGTNARNFILENYSWKRMSH